MIVLEVHVYGLAVLEAEHHPPVAGDPDTPLVRPVALQRMQPEARRVSAPRMCCLLQAEQDTPEPWHETGRQARRVVPLVQRPRRPLCLILMDRL